MRLLVIVLTVVGACGFGGIFGKKEPSAAAQAAPAPAKEKADLKVDRKAMKLAAIAGTDDSGKGAATARPEKKYKMPAGQPPSMYVNGELPREIYLYQMKLLKAHCPVADAAEKATLECKSFELNKQLKSASNDSEKEALVSRKQLLYDDEGRKSEAQKKASKSASQALFTKAFTKYCGVAGKAEDHMCNNAAMKKLYGAQGGSGAGEL